MIDADRMTPSGFAAGHPDICRACARLFGSSDGRIVLAHLRRITLERVLGPDSSEAQLRHLEGQRALMLLLDSLIARGRTDAAPSFPFSSTQSGA